MSSSVKYVSVDNQGGYTAFIRAHYEGSVYNIETVAGGATQRAEPSGIPGGAEFTVSVDVSGGSEAQSAQTLIYSSTSSKVALFTAGGTPRAPTITFVGFGDA